MRPASHDDESAAGVHREIAEYVSMVDRENESARSEAIMIPVRKLRRWEDVLADA